MGITCNAASLDFMGDYPIEEQMLKFGKISFVKERGSYLDEVREDITTLRASLKVGPTRYVSGRISIYKYNWIDLSGVNKKIRNNQVEDTVPKYVLTFEQPIRPLKNGKYDPYAPHYTREIIALNEGQPVDYHKDSTLFKMKPSPSREIHISDAGLRGPCPGGSWRSTERLEPEEDYAEALRRLLKCGDETVSVKEMTLRFDITEREVGSDLRYTDDWRASCDDRRCALAITMVKSCHVYNCNQWFHKRLCGTGYARNGYNGRRLIERLHKDLQTLVADRV